MEFVSKAGEASPSIKETLMNKDILKQLVSAPDATTTSMEQGLLAQWGFRPEEITSLLWLRQWYQTGGSDRVLIVRYLEFLRLLVRSGELEV